MSTRTSCVFATAVATLIAFGCEDNKGDDKGAGTTVTVSASQSSPARAASSTGAVSTLAPTGSGVLSGRVTVTGQVPVMHDITDRKGDPVCARTPMKYNDVVVDKQNDLKDVLVRLAPGSIKGRFPPPADVTVAQKDCTYVPRTFGIQSGGTVIVTNEDKTTHNVHTYEGSESLFNQGQPPGTPDIRLPEAMGKGKTFDEGVIAFKCDIHKYMSAYGVVTDHPYFTVTGPDGAFALEKLPPGKYKLEAWHSMFRSKTQDVEVADGKTVTASFVFNADADRRVP